MGFSPIRAGAVLLLAFLPAAMAASSDRIVLKDGTHLDGRLLYAEERPDAVVLNVAPARGVVERREVPKDGIASISYGDGTDDPAFLLVLPADSQPEAWYAERLRHDLDPWLAQYPKSPRLAEMQARRAQFEAERQRVAAGDIRRGGRWLGPAEAADWAPELAAQALVPALNEAARQADGARLQALLPQVEKAAAAPSYPAVVRAALPALDACAAVLQPGAYADALRKSLAFYQSEQERCAAEIRAVINEKVQGYSLRPGNFTDYTQVGGLWYRDGSYVSPYGEFTAYYDPAILDGHAAVPLSEDTLSTLRGWLRQIDEAKAQAAQAQKDLDHSDASLQQMADAFRQARARLAAVPVAQEEKTAAAVREAGDQIGAGDWAGAEPVLVQANKDWPGNLAVPLVVTDKAPLFLARIDAAAKEGKLAEVEALQEQAAKLVPYLLPDSERARDLQESLKDGPERIASSLVGHLRDTLARGPFAEFLREDAALRQTVQRLHGAQAEAMAGAVDRKLSALEKEGVLPEAFAAQAALDGRDYGAVLAARDRLDDAGAPPPVRAWYRDLAALAQARADASDAQLIRVNRLLLRGDFFRAHAALGHAAEAWPGNPRIEAKTHFFQGVVGVGGAVAALALLLFLATVWNTASTLLESVRYKAVRKKYAKPPRKSGRTPPPTP